MKKKSLFSVCALLVLMLLSVENLKAQWWTEVPPAGKVALHRLINIYTGKHIIAATGEAYSLTQQVNSNGFHIWSREGRLGYIQTAPNEYPIYRYSKNGDNYAALTAIAPPGYTGGLVGYAASATGNYSGIFSIYISIHEYWRTSGGGDHFYTNNYNELGGGVSPWFYGGIAFNIWQ